MAIYFAKFFQRHPLLSLSESHVDHYQYREHHERWNGWPLQQEAEHNQNKSNVLRMTTAGIPACGRQRPGLLRLVQYTPRRGQQKEAQNDQNITGDMQRIPMWITFKTKQRVQQVAVFVGQKS